MRGTEYLTQLKDMPELGPSEITKLEPVAEQFPFRINSYYKRLIDWTDPNDPLRNLVIPNQAELDQWGELDASGEDDYTVVQGCQHKYQTTALLLVNDVCGAYCRFCFRKRLFQSNNDEVVRDVSLGLEYIRAHPEISNVLLTGGDPLLMSTSRLAKIIDGLRAIPSVRVIRIGTKMPAFDPYRVLQDQSLLELIATHSHPDRRIYIMAHFNHHRELTAESTECMARLRGAGSVCVNQTPLIAGVNDTPSSLADLFNKLEAIGVMPYYLFQCRPTLGNRLFSVPLERAYGIYRSAQARCSGLARQARFVMSHRSGKIEVVALLEHHVVFRFHQAANPADFDRVILVRRNPEAHWADDYQDFLDSVRSADCGSSRTGIL